jgi:plasmid stabilization system protein ParE
MNVRIRDEAEAELEAAFDYYQSRRAGLGLLFLDEFRRGLDQIAEAPNRWAQHPASTQVRKYRLNRFPYELVYRVLADHCMIVAVAHQHRRPGYWRKRLV